MSLGGGGGGGIDKHLPIWARTIHAKDISNRTHNRAVDAMVPKVAPWPVQLNSTLELVEGTGRRRLEIRRVLGKDKLRASSTTEILGLACLRFGVSS